jgi:methyl-accepting chemotaxis protein
MFKLVGYTENEGLHKSIQTAYGGLKGILNETNNEEFKSALLTMKIYERNYINDPTEQTISAFKASSKEFKNTTQSMELTDEQKSLLLNWKKNFNTLMTN